jgi:hypothetical protein|tara:strand:+ start:77718 stop:78137 length:420 start_codon:yes stop_codon:yes gene_type:complete
VVHLSNYRRDGLPFDEPLELLVLFVAFELLLLDPPELTAALRGLDELLVLTDLGDAFGLETDLVETAVDDRFGELVFCLTDDDLAVLLVLIVFDFGATSFRLLTDEFEPALYVLLPEVSTLRDTFVLFPEEGLVTDLLG